MWDVFISHASEDKRTVAEPLARLLAKHIRVWIDAGEIRPGDSLRERIDDGLSKSRFGVVVLSKSFFSKKKTWTARELNGLLTRETTENTVIPVWHEVDGSYVAGVSPIMADRLALNTAMGLPAVARSIVKRITNGRVYKHQGEYAGRLMQLVTTGASRAGTLYVSIGSGSYTGQWLATVFRQPSFKISKVVLLALSAKEAKKLESKGLLRPGFASALKSNIALVSDQANDAGVRFECRHWLRFPDFHGFLHGSVALFGKWDQDSKGQWDVHTPLEELMKDNDPEKLRSWIATFKNAASKL